MPGRRAPLAPVLDRVRRVVGETSIVPSASASAALCTSRALRNGGFTL
jgi:hypothetical protein